MNKYLSVIDSSISWNNFAQDSNRDNVIRGGGEGKTAPGSKLASVEGCGGYVCHWQQRNKGLSLLTLIQTLSGFSFIKDG